MNSQREQLGNHGLHRPRAKFVTLDVHVCFPILCHIWLNQSHIYISLIFPISPCIYGKQNWAPHLSEKKKKEKKKLHMCFGKYCTSDKVVDVNKHM